MPLRSAEAGEVVVSLWNLPSSPDHEILRLPNVQVLIRIDAANRHWTRNLPWWRDFSVPNAAPSPDAIADDYVTLAGFFPGSRRGEGRDAGGLANHALYLVGIGVRDYPGTVYSDFPGFTEHGPTRTGPQHSLYRNVADEVLKDELLPDSPPGSYVGYRDRNVYHANGAAFGGRWFDAVLERIVARATEADCVVPTIYVDDNEEAFTDAEPQYWVRREGGVQVGNLAAQLADARAISVAIARGQTLSDLVEGGTFGQLGGQSGLSYYPDPFEAMVEAWTLNQEAAEEARKIAIYDPVRARMPWARVSAWESSRVPVGSRWQPWRHAAGYNGGFVPSHRQSYCHASTYTLAFYDTDAADLEPGMDARRTWSYRAFLQAEIVARAIREDRAAGRDVVCTAWFSPPGWRGPGNRYAPDEDQIYDWLRYLHREAHLRHVLCWADPAQMLIDWDRLTAFLRRLDTLNGGAVPGDAPGRGLSLRARRAVHAAQTGELFAVLLTLTHQDLADPIRVTNAGADVVSRGQTYVAWPFDITLPADSEEGPQRARLSLANVDRRIVREVRLLGSTPMAATIEVVLASQPDVVEVGPLALTLRGVGYDAASLDGDLAYEDLVNEPCPQHVISPANFPAAF